MTTKYAVALVVALAVLLAIAAALAWAFLPARYLPSNRARYLRLRLHLRLHPSKGFATIFSLWLHWGRLATLRRSGRIRRSSRSGSEFSVRTRTRCPSAEPTTAMVSGFRWKNTSC